MSGVTSYVGGARHKTPASRPYMGLCPYFEREVSKTTPYVDEARAEFKKAHPMWAGPDIGPGWASFSKETVWHMWAGEGRVPETTPHACGARQGVPAAMP